MFEPLCIIGNVYIGAGLPQWLNGKDSACSAGDIPRCVLNPYVRKIPWKKTWQPTPVFLPGEFRGHKEPGGLQSTGSQRVGHD